MTVFETLKAQHPVGSKLDTDGFPKDQPYQCYDVFIAYIRLLANNPNLYFSASMTGFAQDIYNQYDSSPTLQSLFTKLPYNVTGQPGDVAVWGKATQTPSSHVAILEADNGTTQHIYGQNQPNAYITERDLTSTGLLGYLRPKTNESGGSMIDQNTLTEMFRLLLGRDPEADAVNHYVGHYEAGFVFNDILNSAEHKQHQQNLSTAQSNEDQQVKTLQSQIEDLQSKTAQLSSEKSELQKELDEAKKAADPVQETPPIAPPVYSESVNPTPLLQALKDFLRGFLGVK